VEELTIVYMTPLDASKQQPSLDPTYSGAELKVKLIGHRDAGCVRLVKRYSGTTIKQVVNGQTT
jgi:hypothetical protein